VARQRNAGSSSSLTRNVRHHKRFSKGYAAGERAAMFHDTAARVSRMAPCHVTAAERQDTQGGLWGGEPANRTTPPSWWEEGWLRSRRGEESRS
jgi:hypothetical protein